MSTRSKTSILDLSLLKKWVLLIDFFVYRRPILGAKWAQSCNFGCQIINLHFGREKLSQTSLLTDAFFCYPTFTEVTYHRQLGKFACFPIFFISLWKIWNSHMRKNALYLILFNQILVIIGNNFFHFKDHTGNIRDILRVRKKCWHISLADIGFKWNTPLYKEKHSTTYIFFKF